MSKKAPDPLKAIEIVIREVDADGPFVPLVDGCVSISFDIGPAKQRERQWFVPADRVAHAVGHLMTYHAAAAILAEQTRVERHNAKVAGALADYGMSIDPAMFGVCGDG